MRFSFQLYIFFLVSNVLYGQNYNKTFIIDSLSFTQKYVAVKYYKPDKSLFNVIDSTLIFKWNSLNQFFTSEINLLDSVSSIRLEFDNLGSFVELKDMHKSQTDTFKISKFKTYFNCLPDTEINAVYKYQAYADSHKNIKLLRAKIKVKSNKKCDLTKNIVSFNISINDAELIIPLKYSRTDATVITFYHGSNKRNEVKKSSNKNYKYFAGESEIRTFLFTGQISLK